MIAAPPAAPPQGWAYLDYPDAAILIQVTTKWEKSFRANACKKEPWTMTWLERMVPGEHTLWNIGANVGSYALIAAKRGVYTVAIEPGYASYAALCNNILANRLEGMMTALPLAVGRRTGIEPLAYRSTEAGAASHDFGAVESKKSVGTMPTLCLTLNQIRAQFPEIMAPSHLLLDVDGVEGEILMAGDDVLRTSVRSVMVEVKRESDQERMIHQSLGAAGLALVTTFDQRDGQSIGGIYYALWERT